MLWTTDFKFSGYINFEAAGFVAWMREVLPCYDELPDFKQAIQLGKLKLGKRLLPKNRCLDIYYGARTGSVAFSEDIDIPMIFSNWDTVMSLTPMEVLSQRPGISKAKGRVLIGGLGMGWFARMVAQRRQVSQIVIVEREQAVIDKFNSIPNATVICGDAFEYAHQHGAGFDRVLFDVWNGCNDAHDDIRWRGLKRELGSYKCWGWGDKSTFPSVPDRF